MATPLLKKMMKGPKCWKGYVAKGKKKVSVRAAI